MTDAPVIGRTYTGPLGTPWVVLAIVDHGGLPYVVATGGPGTARFPLREWQKWISIAP